MAGEPLNPPTTPPPKLRFEKGTTNALDSLAVTAKRFMDALEPLLAEALKEARDGK